MEIRRQEAEEHAEECDWRPVVCEACGHRTVRRDLCTHQSRKKCLEKKLRHQVSRAMRWVVSSSLVTLYTVHSGTNSFLKVEFHKLVV